jgi:hypothetical protein
MRALLFPAARACDEHPSDSRQPAVLLHHPVAGNRHREGIGSARFRHFPGRARRTDPLCDFGIAGRPANGNVAQRMPDPLLERRAAHIERQIDSLSRRFDEVDDLGRQPLERLIGADPPRLRKAILEVAKQRGGIVTEKYRADAPVGRRDKDRAEPTFPNGGADQRARTV